MGLVTVREILDIRVGKLGEVTYTIQSPNYDKRCNIFLEITKKPDGWYGKFVTNPELVERKNNGTGEYLVIEHNSGHSDFQFLSTWLENKLS